MEERKYLDDIPNQIQDLIFEGDSYESREAFKNWNLDFEGEELGEEQKKELLGKYVKVVQQMREQNPDLKIPLLKPVTSTDCAKFINVIFWGVGICVVLLLGVFNGFIENYGSPNETKRAISSGPITAPPKAEFVECGAEFGEAFSSQCSYKVSVASYSKSAVIVDLICHDRDVALFAEASELACYVANGLYGLLEGLDSRPARFEVRVLTPDRKLVGTAHYSQIRKRIKWASGFK